MILLDTSVLIDGLTRDQLLLPAIMRMLNHGEKLALCTMVLFEWLRGPRGGEDLQAQEVLFPSREALPFEVADAEISARIYRSLKRPRTREVDIAIAACAIRHNAALWTVNTEDFADIPGLRLVRP